MSRRTLGRMHEIFWTKLPGVEYVNSVKIALRPHALIKSDFPIHFPLWSEITKDDVVVEIGANLGGNSKEFPRYAKSVHSFEPSPKSFKFLVRNTRGIPNLRCYNAAVSGKTESNQVFNSAFGGGSLVANDDIRYKSQIWVKVVGINDLPFRFNVMVVDAEGAEIEIFEAFDRWDEVDKIYCETHLVGGRPTEEPIRKILEAHYPNIFIDKEQSGKYNWVIAKRHAPGQGLIPKDSPLERGIDERG